MVRTAKRSKQSIELLFNAKSLEEFYESMEWFSQDVISKFRKREDAYLESKYGSSNTNLL